MNPGRELDKLVAEAMGLCPHPLEFGKDTKKAPITGEQLVLHRCTLCEYSEWAGCDRTGDFGCEHYSTDFDAAWQVYQWLEGYGLVQISNRYGDDKNCVFVPDAIHWPSTRLKAADTTSSDYQLAICLTALKAVGVEVE